MQSTLQQPSSSAAPEAGDLAQRLLHYISDKAFPCVGAKSALNKDRMDISIFGALGDPAHTQALHEAISAYGHRYPEPGAVPVTFIAAFDDEPMDEITFERRLWKQLQQLHDLDRARGTGWAGGVSDDPARKDFSFSVGGRAFFVVGLHPGASRMARRAPVPCLVFNFHEQFELLKQTGKYATMQEAIRARDVALQGSINPVLARFGEASEARQYSGRAVEAAWKCPFHSKAEQDA